MSRLAAERVHARHAASDRDALRDLCLEVAPGEILVLVGPNGSGKSTALATLGRTLVPRLGTVRLDGDDVQTLPARGFAQRVARLPQHPSCPEGLTVEDLVLGGRHPHRRFLAPLGPADRAAARAAMRAVDVLDLRARKVETLSGGERRRAWLAMVLCQEAPLLLLDEPTAALDLKHQHEVLTLLARLNRERGVTMVVVLHDLEHAAALAHRLAVLHRGRLYAAGPPATCLTPSMLRDVFEVDAEVRTDAAGTAVRILGPSRPVRFI